jgi:hypothetical protein
MFNISLGFVRLPGPWLSDWSWSLCDGRSLLASGYSPAPGAAVCRLIFDQDDEGKVVVCRVMPIGYAA